MKKNFIYQGLMLLAALAFSTNCAKQETVSIEEGEETITGIHYELNANAEVTKTTYDGSTNKFAWEADDALNVFRYTAGNETLANSINYKFTLKEGSDNTFETENGPELAAGNYDWYVLYPYSSFIKTPKNTSSGYLYIGSSSKSAPQVQDGNSDAAHLSGQYFPLYGKADGIASDGALSVSLKPALSILKVVVTNANEEDLTVNTISFTAPDYIVGSYYIDFSGDVPSFTPRGENVGDYQNKTVSLNVNNAISIVKDGTAEFYIGIKPFTAAAGSDLTISVNGYSKTINLANDVTFSAGKIKTLKFSYDYSSGIAEPTSKTGWYRVEKASWLKAGDKVVIAAKDFAFAMSTEQKTNNRGSVGAEKTADGDYSVLTVGADVQQFTLEAGTVEGSFAFKCYNGTAVNNYIYAASSTNNNLKSQATKDGNASFIISVSATGSAAITAQGTNTHNVIRYNNSGTSNLFSCYTSGQQDVAIYKYYGTSAPAIIVTSSNPVAVAHTGDVVTIEYTIDNPTGATISAASDKAWASGFDYSVDGVVSFTVDAQEALAEARSANITLSYAGASDVVVVVNQEAAPVPVITVTSDNPMAVANTNDLYAVEYTIANPIAGKAISAASDVDWIHDFDYSTPGEVMFEVDAQAVGAAARSGHITLSYDHAENVVVTVNQAAGAGGITSHTSTLTFTEACGGSGTADDGVEWTVTSDGEESNFENDRGIHYGTSGKTVQYIRLSTSDIAGTITKVVVNASTASGVSATVGVTVGGDSFGGDPKTLTRSAAEYTFDGSDSGEIIVTVTKPSSATKAIYVKSIAVTYN